MVRRDCRYYLRYGRDLCKHAWTENIRAEPKDLSLGCDLEGVCCLGYAPLKWKRDSLPPPEREELEADEAKEVLEWDDDESTKNELPPPAG